VFPFIVIGVTVLALVGAGLGWWWRQSNNPGPGPDQPTATASGRPTAGPSANANPSANASADPSTTPSQEAPAPIVDPSTGTVTYPSTAPTVAGNNPSAAASSGTSVTMPTALPSIAPAAPASPFETALPEPDPNAPYCAVYADLDAASDQATAALADAPDLSDLDVADLDLERIRALGVAFSAFPEPLIAWIDRAAATNPPAPLPANLANLRAQLAGFRDAFAPLKTATQSNALSLLITAVTGQQEVMQDGMKVITDGLATISDQSDALCA
jgi:hypothetical protein